MTWISFFTTVCFDCSTETERAVKQLICLCVSKLVTSWIYTWDSEGKSSKKFEWNVLSKRNGMFWGLGNAMGSVSKWNVCLRIRLQKKNKLVFLKTWKIQCWRVLVPGTSACPWHASVRRVLEPEGGRWHGRCCSPPLAHRHSCWTTGSWSNCLLLALSYKLGNSSLKKFLLQPVCFCGKFLF